MGKNNPVVNQDQDLVVVNGSQLDSIQTVFYKFAGNKDEQVNLARRVLELFPKWLDGNLDDVTNDRIKHAILLRHKENNPAKEYGYVEVNGAKHFVEIAPDAKTKPKETMKLDSEIALAYTAQQWGAMKKDDLDKYKVIGEWRTKGGKYVSNVLGDVNRLVAKLLKPEEAKGRSATVDFAPFMKAEFTKWEKRVKIAQKTRGDTTADPAKLTKAIKAFWEAYNK